MAAEAVAAVISALSIPDLMNLLKKQGSYLCCFSCNVQRLSAEVDKLNVKYENVQQGVSAARANLEVNTPEVDSWLAEVKGVQTERDRIRDVAKEVQGKCLCKWLPVIHYCLSRDAVKAKETATELRRNTPPVPVFIPRIPAEIDPVPATSGVGFKSRDSIEEDIMDALNDNQVYLIGIWGAGGVGKTTMAKKIEERVRRDQNKSMFGHVVMAVVSQQPDLQKIQGQIARALGFELNEQDSLIYGARKLRERLKGEKSVLIILDDVWQRLDLDELGIPSQRTHGGCKLILTSRNRHAFTSSVNPDSKIFPLEILTPEESWVLFKENAGIQDDSHDDLIQIAKDVARECKGLPLALKTVGLALRDASKSSWENALGELQQSMPMNIQGVTEDVYKPLMYSINRLESEEARHLFLLCCLFPEDCNITLEELVRCRMALTIFKGLESLMAARNRVETLTRNLISRSLLIESSDRWDNPCVKMHDVIRDVGIWIASEEKIESEGKIASKEKQVFVISHGKEEWPIKEEDSYGNYTCISLIFSGKRKRDIGIPEFISCPRLEFLLLDAPGNKSLNLPETFFSEMKRLRYFCVSNSGSLPSSVGLLNNLRTLHLKNCGIAETISVIGKLTNLEILYLRYCEFMVLPIEIGGLKKLRQLVIEICRSLKRIELGVLSGLVRLEELVILPICDYWQAEAVDNVITNAHLAELDCLNHLTTLKIEIRNPSVIPTITTLPSWASKLKKYEIAVGVLSPHIGTRFQKAIKVGDKAVIPLGDWFYGMASDVDYLDVAGLSCTFFVKKLTKLKNRNSLKHLSLSKFTDVQYLVEKGQQEDGAIFPMLEYLHIGSSDSLQEISNVPLPAGSFEALKKIKLDGLSELLHLCTLPTGKLCLSNLRSIEIQDCQSLSYLFSLSVAQSLSRLEKLDVSKCPSMEQIFKKEDGGETGIHMLEFPKLQYLHIQHLKSLHDLCQGVNRIEFELRQLELEDLPSIIKGKNLFDHLQIAGNYDGLRRLELESMNFKCLFSTSMWRGLSNLESLELTNCSMVEEVIIENDENLGETILFPKLKILSLSKLPKILAFCCGAVEFHSLEILCIQDCPLMESFAKELSDASNSSLPFFSNKVYCPKLKYLNLERLDNTTRIFDLPTFIDFINLKWLSVYNCEKLKEVIVDEEIDGLTNIKEILSHHLEFFDLWGLPMINRFCHTKRSLEFPLLSYVEIRDCPMLERFSLGTLHLPNITSLKGVRDADFASKFFYNKEISSNQIHLEKDCIIIHVKQISIKGIGDSNWFQAPHSSENFIDAVSIYGQLVEITGIFEITMLLLGVVYEIIFMIMLDDYMIKWIEGVEFELKLLGGITQQYQVKNLSEQPRGRWIDLLVGKFTKENCQTNLEFSLFHPNKESRKHGLSIKGVKIIKSLEC